MRLLQSLWQAFYNHAYLLLLATTLFWAGNSIAGRLAVGEVSPMALTAIRWFVVLAVLLPITGREALKAWPELKPYTLKICWMAFFGFTAFNALFYAAAYTTGAANISIIQGLIPIVVMLGAFLLYGIPVTLPQCVGVALAFIGVAVVGLKGDLGTIGVMGFNIGDIWMLVATVFYACYTLGLRHRPAVPGLIFFTALAIVAFLTSLPIVIVEIAFGQFQAPTWKGWLILGYIALFPSLIAQLFYIRGVELIGPSRAGLFVNLIPVFGTLMASMLPGEPFATYHLAGLALVLGGIIMAERK